MAKRFIDTGLFDDSWYMDLTKDSKIFWIYLFTKCDHAGIIEINEKLCKFQTGIKDLQTVYKELGNRIITLKEQYFFIPKFLFFQYPNFPNSNVKAQLSAINRLKEFEVFDDKNQTLIKGLSNSYGYEYGNEYENEEQKKYIYSKFYDEQILIADKNHNSLYKSFVDFLFKNNPTGKPLSKVLKLQSQITIETFDKWIEKYKPDKIKDCILSLENYNKKSYVHFSLTINKWLLK